MAKYIDTSNDVENNVSNNFNDVEKYFIKLAPDFSIFDLAEKQMSEADDNGNYPLYYYSANDTDLIDTNFRRAMFRVNGNVEIKTIDSDPEFSYYRKYNETSGQTIFICISSTDTAISFTLNKLASPIVGVCF